MLTSMAMRSDGELSTVRPGSGETLGNAVQHHCSCEPTLDLWTVGREVLFKWVTVVCCTRNRLVLIKIAKMYYVICGLLSYDNLFLLKLEPIWCCF